MAETKLVVTADVDSFVSQIDKAAETIEYFSNSGQKSIDDIADSYDELTEKQKRSFDASKKQFDEKIDALKKLEKEYEALREKVMSGNSLTDKEATRLKEIAKEYKNLRGAVFQTSKEMGNLSRFFKASSASVNSFRSKVPQTTHVLSNLEAVTSELGISLAGLSISAVSGALTKFGMDMEQQISQLSVMTGSIASATDAYRTLNNAYRNTNFPETSVTRWSRMLINMGYTAKEAASMIQIVADTTAALGGDENSADTIINTLNKIKQNATFTNKELKKLQELGIGGIKEAFAKALGTDTDTAFEKIKKGAINGESAFNLLTNYMDKKYGGAINKAKDNTRDAMGDVLGNVTEIVREIGLALVQGLNLKGLAQALAEFTEKFLKFVRDIKTGSSSVAEAFDELTGYEGSFSGLTSSISGLMAGFVAFKQFKGLDNVVKSVDAVGTSLISVKEIVQDVSSGNNMKKVVLGSALEASNKRAKDKLRALITNLRAFKQAQSAAEAATDSSEAQYYGPAAGQLEQLVEESKQKLRDEIITRKSLKEQIASLNNETLLLNSSTAKTAESTAKAATATTNLANAGRDLANVRNTLILSDTMEHSKLKDLGALIDANSVKYSQAAQTAAQAGSQTEKVLNSSKVSISAVSDALEVTGSVWGNVSKKSGEATKETKRFIESQNGWIRNAGSTKDLSKVWTGLGNSIKNAGKNIIDYAKKVKSTDGILNKFKGITIDSAAALANLGSAAVSAGKAIVTWMGTRIKGVGAAIATFLTNPVVAAVTAVTALVAAMVYGVSKAYELAKKQKYSTLLEDRLGTEGVDENDPTIKAALAQAKRQEEMADAIRDAEEESKKMMEEYGKTIDARVDKARASALAGTGLLNSSGDSSKNDAAKKQEEYLKKLTEADQEAARYRLEQENKINEARKENEIKHIESIVSLLENMGAKEAAFTKRRILNAKTAEAELLKSNNTYSQALLAAQQELANKKYELSKASDAKEKQLIEKQITLIDTKIKDLIASHKNDVIEIKIKTSIDQLNQDLNKAVDDLTQNRAYAKDGRAGQVMKTGQEAFEKSQATTLNNYAQQAQTLATANANGDSNTILSVGQLLGLSVEEIQARGQAVQQMYDVVAQALITTTAAEVDANNQAITTTTEHANTIRKLTDYVNDYKTSVGKEVGNMFSAWITGAKSAGEAMKDFAASLINNAVQIMAQWLGVYAILLACGSNPHAASKGASKAVLGIDGKKDGGLIVGPGTSRSDSIPTMLSNGEYVINARAVDAIGLSNLNALNSGYVPHFAEGGLVGSSNSNNIPAQNNNVSLNISTIDSSSFEDFLRRGGLDKIKQAIYSENRRFAGQAGVF